MRREPPHQQTPSREHTANALLELQSSDSFEGAVGRSVSPAQAWRRGHPTAKHRTGRGAAKECWPAAAGASRGQGGRPAADRAAGLVSGSPRDVCVVGAKTIRHRIWRRSCRGPPPRPPLSSTRPPPQEVAVTAAPLTPRDGRQEPRTVPPDARTHAPGPRVTGSPFRVSQPTRRRRAQAEHRLYATNPRAVASRAGRDRATGGRATQDPLHGSNAGRGLPSRRVPAHQDARWRRHHRAVSVLRRHGSRLDRVASGRRPAVDGVVARLLVRGHAIDARP